MTLALGCNRRDHSGFKDPSWDAMQFLGRDDDLSKNGHRGGGEGWMDAGRHLGRGVVGLPSGLHTRFGRGKGVKDNA